MSSRSQITLASLSDFSERPSENQLADEPTPPLTRVQVLALLQVQHFGSVMLHGYTEMLRALEAIKFAPQTSVVCDSICFLIEPSTFQHDSVLSYLEKRISTIQDGIDQASWIIDSECPISYNRFIWAETLNNRKHNKQLSALGQLLCLLASLDLECEDCTEDSAMHIAYEATGGYRFRHDLSKTCDAHCDAHIIGKSLDHKLADETFGRIMSAEAGIEKALLADLSTLLIDVAGDSITFEKVKHAFFKSAAPAMPSELLLAAELEYATAGLHVWTFPTSAAASNSTSTASTVPQQDDWTLIASPQTAASSSGDESDFSGFASTGLAALENSTIAASSLSSASAGLDYSARFKAGWFSARSASHGPKQRVFNRRFGRLNKFLGASLKAGRSSA